MSCPGYASYSSLPPTQKDIRSIFEDLRDINVDVFTVVTNPFQHVGNRGYEFDYIMDNSVQYIDLQDPDHEYSRQVRSRKKKSNGLYTWEASKKEFNEWYSIHVKRCEEQLSRPIPKRWFESILKIDGVTLKVVSWKGNIIGGTVFVKNDYCCDYYRSAFDSKYFKLNGNTFQLVTEIEACKKDGLKIFNMQSSTTRGDGTWRYKDSFGCKETEHYYLTKVLGSLDGFKNRDVSELKEVYDGYFIAPYNQLR